MWYAILLAPEAVRQLRALSTYPRGQVRDAIERHLRHQPEQTRKSCIERLRGLSQPRYRLRVGEVREYYDVTENTVGILAVVTKAEAQAWLGEHGTPGAGGAPG
jgi:mRNA-degrading endonuclease RelE of RelBE toxin-antitoxin system